MVAYIGKYAQYFCHAFGVTRAELDIRRTEMEKVGEYALEMELHALALMHGFVSALSHVVSSISTLRNPSFFIIYRKAVVLHKENFEEMSPGSCPTAGFNWSLCQAEGSTYADLERRFTSLDAARSEGWIELLYSAKETHYYVLKPY